MSQFILDNQLSVSTVLAPLRAWTTVVRLHDLRPRGEQILDDRVPSILLTLQQPTLLTIDHGFWDRRLCHRKYGIIFFDGGDTVQKEIPARLRELLKKPPFDTRAGRMGEVARVYSEGIEYWEYGASRLMVLGW